MVIVRKEAEDLKKIKKWLFIFGRRKTGKTFLVKNFLQYDEYFFIKNDKGIMAENSGKEIIYETFIELLKRSLKENKIVVVDEFHRLGNSFLDFLHFTEKNGKIILISSTLNLSKNLLDKKSAILGLFAEAPIGLIKLDDCVRFLGKNYKLDKKSLLEAAVLIREPIAVDYLSEKINPRELISEVLIRSIKTMPALIGEIFTEEERSISAVYEGILRAVAGGRVVSTEISSYLFSKKLIKKDDPSLIQQYLANLAEFGIIKKIGVYNKNKFVYKHASPLVRFYYYSDEKYNISERAVTKEEIKRIIDELLPRIIEDNVREFLSEKFGLVECVFESKDFDVDACLLKFKKVDVAVEIKWKDKIGTDDIDKALETLSSVNPREMFLFVPDKAKVKTDKIKVVDITDFVSV